MSSCLGHGIKVANEKGAQAFIAYEGIAYKGVIIARELHEATSENLEDWQSITLYEENK